MTKQALERCIRRTTQLERCIRMMKRLERCNHMTTQLVRCNHMKKQLALERCIRMTKQLERCIRMTKQLVLNSKLALVHMTKQLVLSSKLALVRGMLALVRSKMEQVSSLRLCRNRDQLATYRTDRLVRLTLKPQLLSKQLGLQLKIDSSEPPKGNSFLSTRKAGHSRLVLLSHNKSSGLELNDCAMFNTNTFWETYAI